MPAVPSRFDCHEMYFFSHRWMECLGIRVRDGAGRLGVSVRWAGLRVSETDRRVILIGLAT